MNAITNSNYVNYVPVSVSVSSCFIGSRLGLMTPLTAAAYNFGTRYLFSEGCEGRASCNCCEERMSHEGGRSSCGCFCKGGRVVVVCARKYLLAKGEVELQLLRGNIFSRRGRSSCGCFCEEISSREGGERVATVARKYLLAKGGGRVAIVSARKHLLAGEGQQLTNKDIHGTSG